MMPKLTVCILSSEVPFNGASLCVSRLLPCIDFGLQGMAIGDASIQALAAEDANFDLRHVEPARVFGRVVKLDAAQELAGRSLTQHIIETFPEMGVEIVQHQMYAACPGIDTGEQFFNERDEVGFPPMRSDRDDSHSSLGFNCYKQVGRAIAHVLVVLFSGAMRSHGQWHAAVVDELQALLIDTDHRFRARHRSRVQLKQRVHALAVLVAQYADAPHQPAPGLEIVFFNMRRTVSLLTPANPGSWRATRSNSTIVQRCLPAGGVEHANAVTRASASVSY